MSAITKRSVSEFNNELKLKGFNVFRIEDDSASTKIYSRKDFYKICLTTGESVIHYSDKSYKTDGKTVLFFGNPHVPYSWETLSNKYVGYTCLFSDEFLMLSERSEMLQQSPLFKLDGTPVLQIADEQRVFLNSMFENMIREQQSDYSNKDDVMRNYINLIIHEALKLEPSRNFQQNQDALSRLTNVFLELLERQFPIEGIDQPLKLRTAKDYANTLAVHVNYLNRAVKKVTGHPTTSHINGRIINESKALLLHTDWSVNDIAYSLGFDYPTYFNNFFKKATGTNPGSYRKSMV